MKRFLIFLGLLAAFGNAQADGQVRPSGRGSVLSPTRNVVTFTKLENAWFDAVHRHDLEAIKRYVTEDFEIRSAPTPGVPTALDEALREWEQTPASDMAISQMAVHEYGDLMLVSFLWKLGESAQAQAPKQTFFVIDTWKRSGPDWKVAVRYAAPVLDGAPAVPGTAVPSAQSLRKKP